MKKKSPRGIPDFSPKSRPAKDHGVPGSVVPGKVKKGGMMPVNVKPQATSSKSGQRGK